MNRVTAYVMAACLLAALSTLLLVTAGPGINPAGAQAVICFAALGCSVHLLRFELPRGASGSIVFLPFLTAIALVPGWFAVVTIGVSVGITQIFLRRRALKAIFNIAQWMVAASAASVVYLALGGRPLLMSPVPLLVPYVAFYLAFMAVNTISVSGAVALSEGRSIWHVWRENTLGTVPYDVLSLPMIYFFAKFYALFGVFGAVSLGLPLLGVRHLYKMNLELERVNQDLLQLMVAAIEARDPYTSGHSKRVARSAKIIARAMGLNGKQVDRVGVAALLHDVGKIHEIYAPILRKPDRLTPDELAIMQTHPIKSAELVQHVSQLQDLISPIRHHHENWDGTGYPDGLAGSDIPLAARIIMVADTIDAMTTDRPYRKALDEAAVRAELVRCRGTQFDPTICDALLSSALYSQIFVPHVFRLTPSERTALPARARASA